MDLILSNLEVIKEHLALFVTVAIVSASASAGVIRLVTRQVREATNTRLATLKDQLDHAIQGRNQEVRAKDEVAEQLRQEREPLPQLASESPPEPSESAPIHCEPDIQPTIIEDHDSPTPPDLRPLQDDAIEVLELFTQRDQLDEEDVARELKILNQKARHLLECLEEVSLVELDIDVDGDVWGYKLTREGRKFLNDEGLLDV